MIIASSVFFILFGSWRSYNSLSHAGIVFEKKRSKTSKKKLSAKSLLNYILKLDNQKRKSTLNTLLASTSKHQTTSESQHVHSPIVMNTWPFGVPCDYAWNVLKTTDDSLSAVMAGCSKCEELQCDGTVGFGGSPDEQGETTLDAMIMDGKTHDAGSVASLKRIKSAIQVAHAVMQHTSHTMLVGEAATQFAVGMGFKEESLQTIDSLKKWDEWFRKNCQPNFRRNVIPEAVENCGPYKPLQKSFYSNENKFNRNVSNKSHDTIGMIAMDSRGNLSVGTSTNGAIHKIPGFVLDTTRFSL
jgi:N4-(beta-N-acetylglucosaminyl)-L-asparaginase